MVKRYDTILTSYQYITHFTYMPTIRSYQISNYFFPAFSVHHDHSKHFCHILFVKLTDKLKFNPDS